MKKTEWMKTGVKQEGASLMTPLGLIEGDVLDFVELKGQRPCPRIRVAGSDGCDKRWGVH